MTTATVSLFPCQVGWFANPATGELAPCLCKKLSCAYCAPRKLRRIRARLNVRTWHRFLTLTMPAEMAGLELGEIVRRSSASVRSLLRWLKRHGHVADYVWCREVTRIGTLRPHVHFHLLLGKGRYIPTDISRKARSTLNAAITRCGFGSVFQLRRLRGSRANRYVTNYVSKCTQWLPRYTRRFQTSVKPRLRFLQEAGGKWVFLNQFERAYHYPLRDVPEEPVPPSLYRGWRGRLSFGAPRAHGSDPDPVALKSTQSEKNCVKSNGDNGAREGNSVAV